MKAKVLVLVGIFLLFVTPILLSEDYKKEIPVEDAMKVFCGTWINTGWGTDIDIYNNDGTYEWYWRKTDADPMFKGKFRIEKAWVGSKDNIWFTVWRDYKHNTWALTKISDSGTVLECTIYYEGYTPPVKIIKNGDSFKYVKKKIE